MLRKNLLQELNFSRILMKAAKEKLEIVLSAPVQGEAGGRGGGGGIPPAEPRQFRSDIFKQTTPKRTRRRLVRRRVRLRERGSYIPIPPPEVPQARQSFLWLKRRE